MNISSLVIVLRAFEKGFEVISRIIIRAEVVAVKKNG